VEATVQGIRVLRRDHKLPEADRRAYKDGTLNARSKTLRLYHVVDDAGACIDSLCRKRGNRGCGYGRRKEAADVVREERAALREMVLF
jgi:hypothetical protein